jgi:molybdopterin-guanine dinucleotide biosynthesis protein MobB
MSSPVVFGIYGESDSGKTTLVVQLIRELVREGYTIATVKQTNKDISIDTKNKDTWWHRDAGASLVVFSSCCETDFLLHEPMDSAGIIRRIVELKDVDLIIIEGADDPAIPKIQIGVGRKRSNTIARYDGNVQETLKFIRKEIHKPVPPHLCITIDGKSIPLSDFPEEIITNTILAMLGSLKGVQDIREVRIELK